MELAAAFRRRGHQVTYIAPHSPSEDWYQRHGIDAEYIGPDSSPNDGVEKILQAVDKHRPDLVINNDHPYLQAAIPGIAAPTIVICHAMRWATSTLATFQHQWSHYVVAISYDMLDFLVGRGVPISKLVVAPNGIEDRLINDDVEWGTRGPELRIVFAGNWSRVKGADRIISSIDRAPSWAAEIQLDCFGDGPLIRDAQKRQSDWFRVHGRVSRDAFLKCLRSSDILLAPSRVEGCPMTVIEAMGYGVIPIVSDGLGSMRWMVDAGLSGYVLNGHSWAKQLWPLLNRLKDNRALIQEVGIASRQKFQNHFIADDLADQLLRLGDRPRNSSPPDLNSIMPIQWHRPAREKSGPTAIVDRLAYRFGRLRKTRAKTR